MLRRLDGPGLALRFFAWRPAARPLRAFHRQAHHRSHRSQGERWDGASSLEQHDSDMFGPFSAEVVQERHVGLDDWPSEVPQRALSGKHRHAASGSRSSSSSSSRHHHSHHLRLRHGFGHGRQQHRRQPPSGSSDIDAYKPVSILREDREYISRYMRRSHQEEVYRFEHLPNGLGWRAACEIDIQGRRFTAAGVANTKRLAEGVCRMHMAELIDCHDRALPCAATSPFDTEDGRAAEAAAAREVKPPVPLRLITQHEARSGATAAVGAPPLPPHANAMALDSNAWAAYIHQCVEWVSRFEDFSRAEVLARGEVLLGGDPITDAALIATSGKATNPAAINELERLWRKERFPASLLPPRWVKSGKSLGRRVKALTLTLPFFPHQPLTVSAHRDEVAARAAMAMLEAIGLAKAHIDPSLRTAAPTAGVVIADRREAQAGALPADADLPLGQPTPPPPPPPLPPPRSQELSLESQNRLIELYLKCLDHPPLRPTFAFDEVAAQYTCRLAVGDLVCEGRGINRAEAERSAQTTAYEELHALDEEFREFGRIVETHRRLDPAQVVRVDLPDALSSRVARLTSDVQLDDEEETSASGAPSAHEEKGGGVVDAQTERLLRRVRERRINSAQRNDAMRRRLAQRLDDPEYLRAFAARRASLAMAEAEPELLKAVRTHRVVVVCGTTGCGKTTQVPQYLLDDCIRRGEGSTASIIVTQPRRISAVSISQRIAAERLQPVGDEVGYSIRLDSRPGGHINLCTTGVLLRTMIDDPLLSSVSHLILDEIHERDVNCDFALILVKRLLRANPNIRVLLMSATLAAEKFSSYFDNAPVIQVDGRLFPVEVHFLDHVATLHRRRGKVSAFAEKLLAAERHSAGEAAGGALGSSQQPSQFHHRRAAAAASPLVTPRDIDYQLVATIVCDAVNTQALDGKSILIFMPGWGEILRCRDALMAGCDASVACRLQVVMLHSTIRQDQQMAAFAPAPHGRFKVVIATNIAESGITIDDVAVVIDSGLIKETHWALHRGTTEVGQESVKATNELVTKYCAKANCTQRTGRAGRTQGGTCYRLFTRRQFDEMLDFQVPELLRVPLDSVILRALAMGQHDAEQLMAEALDPPSHKAVATSMQMLTALGAIDGSKRLTTLGRWLSLLPTTPQLGKMIMLAAMLRCLDPVLTLAAAKELNPFIASREVEKQVQSSVRHLAMGSGSDHIATVNAYNVFVSSGASEAVAARHYLSIPSMHNIGKYKRQYFDVLARSGFLPEHADDQLANGGGGDRYFVDRSVYSSHAGDIGLVKGCVCAGLFPNVAMSTRNHHQHSKSKSANGSGGNASANLMRLKMEDSIGCSQRSAATALVSHAESSPFAVYDEIFRVASGGGRESLCGVTVVSIWALLLLGASNTLIEHRPRLGLGVVDGWVMFKTSPGTIENVLKLKKLFNAVIWEKLRDPGNATNNQRLADIQGVCREILNLSVATGEVRTAATRRPQQQQQRQQHAVLGGVDGDGDGTAGVAGSDLAQLHWVESGKIVPATL